MDTATSTTAPSVHVTCPACSMRISLRVWPDVHGFVEPDPESAGRAIGLHLRVGCEAT
jgi:hypothetical protein